jgi:hypothetical protein
MAETDRFVESEIVTKKDNEGLVGSHWHDGYLMNFSQNWSSMQAEGWI